MFRIFVALLFREDHFIILMLTTALVLMVPSLGLTLQFGHAGIANFAGAASSDQCSIRSDG